MSVAGVRPIPQSRELRSPADGDCDSSSPCLSDLLNQAPESNVSRPFTITLQPGKSPGASLDGKDDAPPPPPPPGPPPDVPRTTVPVQRRNMQTLLGESPHKDDEAKYRV